MKKRVLVFVLSCVGFMSSESEAIPTCDEELKTFSQKETPYSGSKGVSELSSEKKVSSKRWWLGSVLLIQDNGVVLFNMDDEPEFGLNGLAVHAVCKEKTSQNRTRCTDLLATWEKDSSHRVILPIKGEIYGNDFKPDLPNVSKDIAMIIALEEGFYPDQAHIFKPSKKEAK